MASDGVEQIIDAKEKERYDLVFTEVNKEDVDAQFYLGVMYANGRGVPQDYAKAVQCYKKAADQGHAFAQNNLGVMYDEGQGVAQDYPEAVKWYRRAADQGDAFAQRNLGWMYANGRGVAQDYAEAVKWYRRAADQGDATAQNNLGVMYEKGQSVAQDYAEAVKWYRRAADQGDAFAQNNLGVMYARGRGVAQDYPEAVKWYRKAADQDNALAQSNLGEHYIAIQDYSEGYAWSMKAYNQGKKAGGCHIGILHEYGLGREKSIETAIKYYRDSADDGYPLAQVLLGRCYITGAAGLVDEEEAQNLFAKAIEPNENYKNYTYDEIVSLFKKLSTENELSATLFLAVLYERGLLGITKENKKAIEYYRKAVELGCPQAQLTYTKLFKEMELNECENHLNTLFISFPSEQYAYSPEQLTAACATQEGRGLITPFRNQLVARQREQNFSASLMMSLLLGSVGIVVILVLLYRHRKELIEWIKPTELPIIKIISEESIKAAIESQDFEMLSFILNSTYDVCGYSFVGMDLELLEPITVDELKKKGVVITLDELLQESKKALFTPEISKSYIAHLGYGVKYLLNQWLTQDLGLSGTVVEQLDAIAKAELARCYRENLLPSNISEHIVKKRTEQIARFFSQWKANELSPEHNRIIDEFICDALWVYWKEAKETDALYKTLTSEMNQKLDSRLLTRFKTKDLPSKLLEAWKNRLAECLLKLFDGLDTRLSKELTSLIKEEGLAIVKEKHEGRLPRNTDDIYKEAINGVLSDWLACHTIKAIADEIDVFATEARVGMQIDVEFRARVEKEAMFLIVSEHKQKQKLAISEDLIEEQISLIFGQKLSSLCVEIKRNSLHDLQEQATTAAIDNTFADWKDNPSQFDSMSLMGLLPELQSMECQLLDKVDLKSKERKIEALEKELEKLRGSSSAARKVGLLSSPQLTTANVDAMSTSTGKEPAMASPQN